MKKIHWRSSFSFLALLTAASTAQIPAHAQPDWSRNEQDYARPRDLVALQDDLNQLEVSLGALPPRHPRSKEFRRRTAAIRADVSALADRIGRDRRDGRFDDRYGEERYGAAMGGGGGFLATRGQDLDPPEGTRIVLRLDRSLTLPRRDVLVSRRN